MITVLFACVHNAGRSQIAAALFNQYADPNRARAISAGTQPATRVHPEVVEAMRTRGIDLASHTPQKLTPELASTANWLITMGCGDECPVVPGARRDDWPIQDPKGQSPDTVDAIIKDIDDRVRAFITHSHSMGLPRILVISGSMGAGKTTVMGEASDLLTTRRIVHAAFDLDALGLLLLPEPQSRELHYRNIAMLYDNCRDAGIEHFLIAVAVESREALDDLRRAAGDADVTVCRLTATLETMAKRLRTREVGFRQPDYLERSRVLDSILDSAGVEDFRIANDGQSVTTVATEMLVRANWMTVQ